MLRMLRRLLLVVGGVTLLAVPSVSAIYTLPPPTLLQKEVEAFADSQDRLITSGEEAWKVCRTAMPATSLAPWHLENWRSSSFKTVYLLWSPKTAEVLRQQILRHPEWFALDVPPRLKNDLLVKLADGWHRRLKLQFGPHAPPGLQEYGEILLVDLKQNSAEQKSGRLTRVCLFPFVRS